MLETESEISCLEGETLRTFLNFTFRLAFSRNHKLLYSYPELRLESLYFFLGFPILRAHSMKKLLGIWGVVLFAPFIAW